MTGKQELFIREYLSDMNATQAAIRAGYSQRTAYSIGAENLTKPEIRQAIESAMLERRSKLIATREQRQEFWSSVMNDAEQDIRARLRASELLGKSEGDFTDKLQVQDNSVNYDVDAQIRRLILLTDQEQKESEAAV